MSEPAFTECGWPDSCDFCRHQGGGNHYCDLHGVAVKNMDMVRCGDWEESPWPETDKEGNYEQP